MKNAQLEALGNSQNNPGTCWNLAVQLPLANSTILGRVRNFPQDFQATVRNKLGAKFSCAKKPLCEAPPPPPPCTSLPPPPPPSQPSSIRTKVS